jgi:serine/threonine-protein kinase
LPPDAFAEADGQAIYQGRYVLGPVLGKGGTCTVYRAWDTDLQRHVAIKRLEPPLSLDPHARARFNREGKAIARLSHPNLVTLIDRGTTETEEYLVFQYVQGRSLKDLIQANGPLDPGDAGQIAGQVAEGLAQAHLAGIVHRDVKPQNILLDAEGRAKLIDFGIATGEEWTHVTREGAIVGSSRYMSPEQVQGRPVDQRTDIYSLGIVLYEMLTGEPPFKGSTIVEIGRQHVRDRPRPLTETRPDIPPSLDRVAMRCLEKLPESRFQSMDELLGALVGLDLYHPQHAGGIIGTLRRTVMGGRTDSLGDDSNEWVPPPDADELPAPMISGSSRGDAGRPETEHEGEAGSAPGERPPTGRGPRRTELKRRGRDRRPIRRVGLWIGLAAGLVAVAIGAYLLFGGQQHAPNLIGTSLEQAKAVAAKQGLQVEVDAEQKLAPDKPDGTVVAQNPLPGKAVPNDVLRLVVSRKPVAVKVTSLQDVDPQGDQREQPGLLPRLIDGDNATFWATESYGTASFGNLGKTGVGVDFKLDSPATLLQVTSPQKGWGAEVQVPGPDGALVTVAKLDGLATQTVDLGKPVKSGRIWITRLAPSADGRYNAQIAELRFFR